MSELKFDKTINLGNVITIIIAVLSVVAGYMRLEAKAIENSNTIKEVKKNVEVLKNSFVQKEVYDLGISRLDRMDKKLDRLIELQLQGNK